jgi:hypothetical protein
MPNLAEEILTSVNEVKDSFGAVTVEHVQNDIGHYFNLSIDELSDMSKQDCVMAQYMILQYSLSITKKINNIKSKLIANKKEFNRAFSAVYNSYNSYNGYEIIYGLATTEHEHLKTMDTEITKLECLIQEYDTISVKAEKLSQIFRDLSFCQN